MSFLTCFCDLPQKLHLTRSPPSPNFATVLPSPLVPAPPGLLIGAALGGPDGLQGGGVPSRDHFVYDPVRHSLVCGHHEVAIGVLGHLVMRLPSVLSQHPVEEITHAEY